MFLALMLMGCTGSEVPEVIEPEKPKRGSALKGKAGGKRPVRPPEGVDPDVPEGAGPNVDRTEPGWVQPGSWIYLFGDDLVPMPEGLQVLMTGRKLRGQPVSLIVQTDGGVAALIPPDLAAGAGGTVDLDVRTKGGSTHLERAILIEHAKPFKFAGARGADAGHGWFATWIELEKGASALPVMDKACELPHAAQPCPSMTSIVNRFDLRHAQANVAMLAQVETWIDVEKGGKYGFKVCSDDSARLTVEREDSLEIVADHVFKGGSLFSQCDTGSVELEAGEHKLFLDYINDPSIAELRVSWTPPGEAQRILGGEDVLLMPGARVVEEDGEQGETPGVTEP
jgi:hypothetical protein